MVVIGWPKTFSMYPAGTATLWQCCHSVVLDVVTTLWHGWKWKLWRHRSPALWQCCHNIKHLVSRPFYYGQFSFLSCHRKVRELQKYLSTESSLWQARRTVVNSWLCLLLVCEQGKVARLGAKVAMKGLGRGKKRLQHNFSNLFLNIPIPPDKWSLHGKWTWNTHPHTHKSIKCICG